MLKRIHTNPNDNYSSLSPYYFVALIHGLKNLEKQNSAYRLSKIRYVLALINLFVFLLASKYQQYKYSDANGISDVYDFCFQFFYVGISIRMILIYILCIKDGNKDIDLHKSMDGFDALLKKIDVGIRIDYKSIYYKSMFIVVFAIITEATTEIFIYLVSYSQVNIYVLITHLMPLFIGDLSKCHFYLWTCIIKARFAIINEQMAGIKRSSKRSKICVLSVYKFEKDFTLLMDLHKRLTEIAREMNKMFQIDMVLHFLLNFLVGFANAYYCIYMLAKERGDNAFYWFIVIKYYVFLWFEYYVLIRSCKELCEEAENTRIILCNTNIDVNDDISHRLAIASIYELNENKLTVTACRLFDIDYSTIFVMFATISNYVFIMLQFEDGQENSNSTITHKT